MDSSRSIRGRDLERVKKAARGFSALLPGGQLRGRPVQRRVRISCPLTPNATGWAGASASESSRSRTQLYTAVYDSIGLLGRDGTGARPLSFLPTAGTRGAAWRSGDVVALAKETSVPVHVVAVRPGKASRGLERIARLTGGSFIRCCADGDIRGLYATLKAGGSARYDVRFRSMAPADGKPRAIEIRLRHDSLRDRDTQEVIYRRGITGVELPPLPQILLVGLVIIIIILLIGCVLVLLRRGTLAIRRAAMAPAGFVPGERAPFVADEFEAALKRDEEAKLHRDRLVTSQDPEYVYARAWLVQKDGPEVGKKFPMYWEEITIGRDAENAIVIRDDAVSLRHARIKEMKARIISSTSPRTTVRFSTGKNSSDPGPCMTGTRSRWDALFSSSADRRFPEGPQSPVPVFRKRAFLLANI